MILKYMTELLKIQIALQNMEIIFRSVVVVVDVAVFFFHKC